MLPKQNRLIAKRDFEFVKKKGEKFSARLFGLLVFRTGRAISRFGFVLSNRLSKRATKRNRAKRLLREAVRPVLPQVKPGFDLIFLGKPEILGKSLPEIQFEIKSIFKKAGLTNVEEEVIK